MLYLRYAFFHCTLCSLVKALKPWRVVALLVRADDLIAKGASEELPRLAEWKDGDTHELENVDKCIKISPKFLILPGTALKRIAKLDGDLADGDDVAHAAKCDLHGGLGNHYTSAGWIVRKKKSDVCARLLQYLRARVSEWREVRNQNSLLTCSCGCFANNSGGDRGE